MCWPPAPFLRAPTSITGDTDYAKRWPALRMWPLELAGVAARIAALSIRLLEEGNPNVQGDVFTAALLAVAVIRAATMLTEINVNVGALGGDRMLQAGRYRATAAELERRIGRLEGRSERS